MPFGSAALRLIAVLLLLLAGVELFACELISPETCEMAGGADPASPDDRSSGDECFCCCSHVVVAGTVQVVPSHIALASVEEAEVQPPTADPPRHYRPPRS